MNQEKIGKFILKLRREKNMTQQELADMLGVSFPSVNRWENGHYEPTIIAKVRLDELFKENNIELCEVTNYENN